MFKLNTRSDRPCIVKDVNVDSDHFSVIKKDKFCILKTKLGFYLHQFAFKCGITERVLKERHIGVVREKN